MQNIIVIDANIALHYQRIDQINWLSILGEERCEIAIVPQLMTELERKKVFASSEIIRKRAANYIDYLVRLMDQNDPIKLRKGTNLIFIDHEPSIDFKSENLAHDIGDDRYIASCLELKNSKNEIWLASQDGGIALKLRHRPINLLRLSDTYKLPEEIDPSKKELRKAKAEIERYKNARPSLRISFLDQQIIWSEELKPIAEQDLTLHERVRASYPIPPKPKPTSIGDSRLRTFAESAYQSKVEIWQDAIASRDVYLEKYDQYLSRRYIWEEKRRRLFELKIELHNDGLASANHVDVKLFAPDMVEFFDRDDFEECPSPPERPRERSWDQLLVRPAFSPSLHFDHRLRLPDNGDVNVSSNRKLAAFEINVMKPKCLFSLETFCVYIAPDMVGRTFQISAEITYAEGEPIFTDLPIRVIEAKD